MIEDGVKVHVVNLYILTLNAAKNFINNLPNTYYYSQLKLERTKVILKGIPLLALLKSAYDIISEVISVICTYIILYSLLSLLKKPILISLLKLNYI